MANSVDVVKDGDALKSVPDNKLFVIDLTASPPAVIATIQTGKQPSGMAINRAGNLALVANRADNSVSVLSISGKTVAVVGTVALAPADAPSQQPSAVAIIPDGKRALVAKATANKVALLDIDGTTVTYKGYDMLTGLFPYNVQITADGKLGLVNHDGNAGVADGQVSTVAVIDMTLDPPREIDQVAAGDGPEGLAVSPTGGYAVTLLTNGSGGSVPNNAFFRHDHAVAVLLKAEDKKVRKLGETEVGTLAEGIAFSPDGQFLYVANFGEQELATYRLEGDKLLPVGALRYISGTAAIYDGTLQMVHPDRVVSEADFAKLPLVEPVYPLTEGLTLNQLRRAADAALTRLPSLPEWQEPSWLARERFPSFAEALRSLHRPLDPADALPERPAWSRLAFDELLAGQVALALLRAHLRRPSGRATPGTGHLRKKLIGALPFALTSSQTRAVADITAKFPDVFPPAGLIVGLPTACNGAARRLRPD